MLDDIRKFEPFWDKWYIVEQLGSGSFGEVYKIKREEYGEIYFSAMKVISIPRDRAELNEASLTCGTREKTMTYFDGLRQNIVKEINIMERFKGKTNFVCYEDHEIIPKNGGKDPGYDIFIRMELLEDLSGIAAKNSSLFSDNKEIVKIGKDMCGALKRCHAQKIIHRDIKPGNIFRSRDGDYKLGDFGIARNVGDSSMTMSVKGTFDYMAPEVYNREHYDYRADIYSLGMVMYHMLNAFRAPFLSDLAGVPTADEKQQALIRRVQGEALPRPRFAFGRLAEVIGKACAFRPDGRYASMEELEAALDSLEEEDFERTQTGGGREKVGMPEESDQVTSDERTVILKPLASGLPRYQETTVIPEEREEKEEKKAESREEIVFLEEKEKKGKRGKAVVSAALAGVVLLICGGLILAHFISKKEPEELPVKARVITVDSGPEEEEQAEKTELPAEPVAILPVCVGGASAEEVKAGETLGEAELSAEFQVSVEDVTPVLGKLKWNEENLMPEKSGEYEWTFYPEDTAAYRTVDGTAWVTVFMTDTVIGLEEFEAVEDKKSILDLDLSNCGLTELSILEGADNLEYVTLDGNELESIDTLKEFKNLRFISLVGNAKLSDITPILKLENLQAVFLDGTAVTAKNKKRIQTIIQE